MLIPAAGLQVALDQLIPISIVVMILLVIVVTSYRQTIFAYPSGGGAYIVAKENLGETPALVAGCIAARRLHPHRRRVDLRRRGRHHLDVPGVRSTTASTICVVVRRRNDADEPPRREGIGPGVRRTDLRLHLRSRPRSSATASIASYFGDLGALPPDRRSARASRRERRDVGRALPFILLRAFSSGAVALSGTEAISNGVPAFRKPESKNAATTLTWMGLILGVSFFGISVLAHRLQPTPTEDGDAALVMGSAVFGDGTFMYLLLADLDVRHLDPGGQHRLCRLPPAEFDHRPRRLPSPPAGEPGRPARLLKRRTRAGGRGRDL